MSEIYKVEVETEDKVVAEKVMELFTTYRSNFLTYILGQLRAQGIEADPHMEISKDDFKVVIQTVARDKGIVWALDEGTGKPNFKKYTDLKEGERYVLFENGVLALYKKNDEKTPDTRYGHFYTVEDMYNEMATIQVPEPEDDQPKKAEKKPKGKGKVVKMTT